MISSEKNSSLSPAENCVDAELFDKCENQCKLDYFSCLSNCDSSICQNSCAIDFAACTSACPCGVDCPNGCDGETELKEECEGFCRVDYNRCRILCESEYCESICEREYQNCRDDCPCGKNCEQGCINCENPICPQSDQHILVLGFDDMANSYVLSGDGLTKNSAFITASETNYAELSAFAVVKGESYIFGGSSDDKKIAKIEGCSFAELSVRLNFRFQIGSSAIEIDSGERALICFDYSTAKKCEIFDTSSIVTTHSSEFSHRYGSLGYYQGQPTSVGSGFGGGFRKVETYSSLGWSSLAEHPKDTYGHTLTGLESGAMVMAGGYDPTSEQYLREIWLLKDEMWTSIGLLKDPKYRGSAVKIGEFIFIVAPRSFSPSPNGPRLMERVTILSDTIIETEIIGSHEFQSYNSVIFQVKADFCIKPIF
ncbi:Oidioi.mRNA.OKI2018_I69.chr1.g1666.t1.cds [Oikopleura dioica]|uniref:Oidioi.mRNA.OKI2018_I69.chr1.g1666.t1.cds n=1 Tax=Oikopleura dioica TaxID=34765 RepID=A0ABN7SNL9_OIKDI|nr:Oidioi.mRNA.OKI2018_I69.chr1.g1666.t1.cds [Oikopleura dioica]